MLSLQRSLKVQQIVGSINARSRIRTGVSVACFSFLNRRDSLKDVPYESSIYRTKEAKKTDRSIPESADVVVIGGGSIGCSTAYHLAKLSVGKIVLIEKERLTAGTTWHTGGILLNLHGDRAHMCMQSHTQDLLSRILPEETGFDAGWLKTGSIAITRRKIQLEELEKKSLMGSEFGIESRMVDVEEISKLHPLLDLEGIVGGLYSPCDGSLDPSTLCTSYIKAASKYSAKVYEGCEVTNIHTKEGLLGLKKVTAVETSLGRIQTDCVVNCTGVWAPYIAEMVGLHVPQVTYKHTYFVTQGIPGIENAPHITDSEQSCYLKRQGDALLFGGDETNPALVEKIEKDFAFSLYDVDWDRSERLVQAAVRLIPDVAKVGLRSTVCGPEAYNMDGNPVMGEAHSVKGFFHACGFDGAGMMMGGGAGKQLAHWIVNGSPEYDLSCCDINRFSTKLVRHRPWVIESSHEHLVQRYTKHHANKQPLSGRNMRITPLHQIHIRNGAFLTCVHGWEVPEYFVRGKNLPILKYDYLGSYGNKVHEEYEYRNQMEKDCSYELQEDINEQVGREILSTTKFASLFDLSHLSKFRFSSESAVAVLRLLFTSDVSKLEIGKNMRTLMLQPDGMILSNVDIFRENSECYRITAPSQQQEFILKHILQLMQEEKFQCHFEDITDQHALFHLRGPLSCDVLENVAPGMESLERSSATQITIAGKSVTVSRCSMPGLLPGYDIYCGADDAARVYETLASSDPKPVNAGIRALKSLDLEAGHDSLLHRIIVGSDPREAGFEHSCSLNDERQLIGKDAFLKRLDQPVKTRLIQLTTASKDPIFPGDVIWRNGAYVGTIEEAVYGYKTNKFYMKGFIQDLSCSELTDNYISCGKYTVGRASLKIEAQLM